MGREGQIRCVGRRLIFRFKRTNRSIRPHPAVPEGPSPHGCYVRTDTQAFVPRHTRPIDNLGFVTGRSRYVIGRGRANGDVEGSDDCDCKLEEYYVSDSHLSVRHLLRQMEDRRTDRSRGLQLPEWLQAFIGAAAECLEPESDEARAGYVCSCTDNGWQVTLFLGMTEIVGGADDGAHLPTGFRVDLDAIRKCFDRVDHDIWEGAPSGSDSNPVGVDRAAVIIDGVLQGQPLRLELALRPPEGVGPGLLRDAEGRCTPAE